MPNYTRKAVHGAGIVLAMSLLASALAYLTKVLLARKLGAADYGLFSAVLTFVIFFLFFRDLGFPQAIIKYTAQFLAGKEYGKIKSVLWLAFKAQMAGSFLFAAAFFLLSGYLALHYFGDIRAGSFLNWFLFYIFGSVFFIMSKDTLLGLQQTFLFSLGELLKNGLLFLLILLFLQLGQGAFAPVYAYALVCWLLFLFFFPFLLRHFPFYKYKCESQAEVRKQMIPFAIFVFATAVGSKVIGYIDTLILTYFRPLSEVGIYNAVLPSALLFLYFGTAVGTVALPMASELWARNDLRRLKAGLELVYKYIFVPVIPIAAAVFAYAGFFLELFFGTEYGVGAPALRILLVGALVFIPAAINHAVFSAVGKPAIVTKIIVLGAVVNALLNFILIPPLGITGAAVSTAVSYALAFFLSVRKMKELLEIPYRWNRWAILFLLGSLQVLILLKMPEILSLNPLMEMAFSFALSLLLYILLLYLFKLIDVTEIKKYVKLIYGKNNPD